jgi:hypothetical protein
MKKRFLYAFRAAAWSAREAWLDWQATEEVEQAWPDDSTAHWEAEDGYVTLTYKFRFVEELFDEIADSQGLCTLLASAAAEDFYNTLYGMYVEEEA